MAPAVTSWTQEEWIDFLANKCHIKREKAQQIAAQMAEQDFNTAKFKSIVNEWMLNAKGCMEILLEIGFKHLDIFPFIDAIREHISESAKEAQKDLLAIQELKMAPIRRMCNELVRELCLEIPIVRTSERILLTSFNMHTYLEPRFSKMLIYRDLITFLTALLNAKKKVVIWIGKVDHNNESEPIVVVNQKQWDEEGKTIFELETNKFRVQIGNDDYRAILVPVDQFKCAHLDYFLRLIAPLLQPIRLRLGCILSRIPIDGLIRFLNTQSDWIDSIRLWDDQFNLEPIYGTLWKYNKLEISRMRSPVDVQKLIHWLTSNNNSGQPKYLYYWNLLTRFDDRLTLLIDELKKEFARATSKCRFVVHLGYYDELLDEFTLCNELTGEKLKLRIASVVDEEHTYALSRVNELDDNENDRNILDVNSVIRLR